MKPIILSLLLLASATTVTAQEYVYGDPATNKYYGINCSEVGQISKPVGFKSSAAAEKSGYIRGTGCVQTSNSASAAYFGDKELSQIYVIDCWYGSMVAQRNWITFATKEDAERHGYTLLPCPPMPPPKKEPKAKVSLERLPRLIAITSEPKEWLGKVMTVEAAVSITDDFKYDDNTYSFRLSDGSASMNVYMEKSRSRPLRDLILAQPAANGVHGQFTFYMDPDGYFILKELYGKLVDFRVTAQ